MLLTLLKGKIHRATVTEANLAYEGSIAIDPALIKAAGFLVNERVDIYNCNNGQRFSTYVILGKPGEICLNGAAARLGVTGDEIIIAAYAQMDAGEAEHHQPSVVMVDGLNQMKQAAQAA